MTLADMHIYTSKNIKSSPTSNSSLKLYIIGDFLFSKVLTRSWSINNQGIQIINNNNLILI